eukprot:scaffold3470_cov178-Alexandrium_tamarense.AAC.4
MHVELNPASSSSFSPPTEAAAGTHPDEQVYRPSSLRNDWKRERRRYSRKSENVRRRAEERGVGTMDDDDDDGVYDTRSKREARLIESSFLSLVKP